MDHERLHCNDSLPLLHVSYWSKMTKKLSSYRCEIRVMWRAKGSMLKKKKNVHPITSQHGKKKVSQLFCFFFSCYEWRNTEKLTLSGLGTMEQFQTNREHTLSSCQKIFMWRVGEEKKTFNQSVAPLKPWQFPLLHSIYNNHSSYSSADCILTPPAALSRMKIQCIVPWLINNSQRCEVSVTFLGTGKRR